MRGVRFGARGGERERERGRGGEGEKQKGKRGQQREREKALAVGGPCHITGGMNTNEPSLASAQPPPETAASFLTSTSKTRRMDRMKESV